MKKVITYGTFDLLHPGHIDLLKKAKKLGDYLMVGLSTDKFALEKGKKVVLNYRERKLMLESLKYVDKVIPEYSHDQKTKDVSKYQIDTFIMGGDYKVAPQHKVVRDAMGKLCKVKFIPRSRNLSTTKIKECVKQYCM